MRIGDRAQITRRFTEEDLALFLQICGGGDVGQHFLGASQTLSKGHSTVATHIPASHDVPLLPCSGRFVPDPLIAGLFSSLLGTQLPGPGTGWLKQELRHHARARLGELLTAEVEVTRLRPEKRLADLTCLCTGNDGRLLCNGRALMLLSS